MEECEKRTCVRFHEGSSRLALVRTLRFMGDKSGMSLRALVVDVFVIYIFTCTLSVLIDQYIVHIWFSYIRTWQEHETHIRDVQCFMYLPSCELCKIIVIIIDLTIEMKCEIARIA
jgi:hypothetical protein